VGWGVIITAVIVKLINNVIKIRLFCIWRDTLYNSLNLTVPFKDTQLLNSSICMLEIVSGQ